MEGPKHVVVGASLADQGLAIGLGSNLPSAAGGSIETLVALRPLLIALFPGARLQWSPLFRTAPLGGPPGQPDYINAVLLVEPAGAPTAQAALALLGQLQALEQRFGRVREERWGPRTLDLDLLWWGDLRMESPELELPHPRWSERAFVLAPLSALDQRFQAPLERLLAAAESGPAPQRLPPREGWPECAVEACLWLVD